MCDMHKHGIHVVQLQVCTHRQLFMKRLHRCIYRLRWRFLSQPRA